MELNYVKIIIGLVIIYFAVIYVALPKWIWAGFNFAFFLEAIGLSFILYFIYTWGDD